MPYVPQKGDALLIIDVQRDFLPGGALAVKDGDKVIPPINQAISAFLKAQLPIFFSRDWHPSDHSSFRPYGGPWPPHCIQGTNGAAFPSNMLVPETAIILSKGTDKEKEQYSAFEAQDADGKTLKQILPTEGIKRLFVGGLATDYCVLNTVLDLLGAGYQVIVLVDACRAVNVEPDDEERALERMKAAQAEIATLEQLKVS